MNKRGYLFVFLLYSLGLQAQTPGEKLSALLKKIGKETQTLQCHFEQEKFSPLLESTSKSSGQLYFKQPKSICWKYQGEKPSSIVFNEEKAFLESNGKRKEYDLDKNPIFRKMNELIAKSVQGQVMDQKEFNVRVGEQAGYFQVEMKPKVGAVRLFVKEIQLKVNTKGLVEALTIFSKNGDWTKILFSQQIVNGKLEEGLFK
jgi:outer membrane lipoprotein-sorting protein